MDQIQRMTQQVVDTYKEYEKTGTLKWTYEIAAKDMPYQVGSLTKALMQLHGERHAGGQSREEIRKTIGDELVDILSEVLFIAHELDIDIHEAWENMLGSDQKKISERSTDDANPPS